MNQRTATLERYRRHVNRGVARLAELMGVDVEAEAVGSHVFDGHGRKYLDCGGYCVFLLGHRHPALVDAVKAQIDRMPLSSRVLINADLARAAEALASVTPEGLDYVWFGSSGAEAVEAALKVSRLNGKSRLIAMEGAYHGKTLGALSVTGNTTYREPFEPLLPGVEFVPFGDAAAIEERLAGGGEDCCVILEPVQSERGVVIPPRGYLKAVESCCRRAGAMLILDEISCGMGRIGSWWGADREGVIPDVLLAGKALSGGIVPVSALVCTAESYRALNRDPILHTSTFAGNPLAAVAARTTIEVVRRENLVERSRTLGERLLAAVRIATEGCDAIREVRGLGLLLGLDFHEPHRAGEFILSLMRRRVLVSLSLNAKQVVRLTPPATLAEEDLDWLVSAVEESAAEVASSRVRSG